MRIAVVQHEPVADQSSAVPALHDGVEQAIAAGARSVVVPCVPEFVADPAALVSFRESLAALHADLDLVVPCPIGGAFVPTRFGLAHVCAEDACLHSEPGSTEAAAFVWQFTPESELQAEALLEFAIDVSMRVGGPVVIAATGSREQAWPARGSAIVQAGEVFADAAEGDAVLVADVAVAVEGAREAAVPEQSSALPPILAQRLAAHEGRKLVPSYPADLS